MRPGPLASSRRPVIGEGAMTHYRLYSVGRDGHYLGPAQIIECADDEEACRKASQFVNGCEVELWEGARFITRYVPRNRP
jgi:hypothetical protein